jgi:hypothetical protein
MDYLVQIELSVPVLEHASDEAGESESCGPIAEKQANNVRGSMQRVKTSTSLLPTAKT